MCADNYITTINETVLSSLEYLLDLGYCYESAEEDVSDKLLGRQFIAKFINKSASRVVEITYIPKAENEETSEVLILHLDNLENDTFSIGGYLKSISKSDSNIDISLCSGHLDKRLKQCLLKHKEILMSDLREIVTGKKWVHVPIDWGDYK